MRQAAFLADVSECAKRQRERELQAIRCRIRKLIEKLEAADDTNIPAKRLYFEILDRERDRLEGKPFTQPEPPKSPSGDGDNRLQEAMRKLYEYQSLNEPMVSPGANGSKRETCDRP